MLGMCFYNAANFRNACLAMCWISRSGALTEGAIYSQLCRYSAGVYKKGAPGTVETKGEKLKGRQTRETSRLSPGVEWVGHFAQFTIQRHGASYWRDLNDS